MNHMRVHDTTIKKLFNRGKIPNKRKIQQELYKNLQDIYTNLLESKRLMYNVHLLRTEHYKLSVNFPTTSATYMIINQTTIMLKIKSS